MVTIISIVVGVLIGSWIAARAARLWGYEDLVFALAMFGFLFFATVVVLFPLFGYSVQNPIYLLLLLGTFMFGCTSVWMAQD